MAIIQPSQLATGSYSLSGSFSGSFQGSGAGLNNIPSSAIVGLSSTQIASGNVTASVSTGTGSFTVTSGSSTFMFVSSSGNVGIGTITPSQSLSVQNGVIIGNASFGAGLITTFDGTSISMVRGGSTTTISSGFGGLASIGTVSSAPFRIFTSNSARMQINDTGNIQIGTLTDAGFKLDVNGTTRLNGATTLGGNTTYTVGDFQFTDGTYTRLRFQSTRSYINAPGGTSIELKNSITSGYGAQFLGVNGSSTNGSVFQFTNSYSGNLGIGTFQNVVEITPTGVGNGNSGTPTLRGLYLNILTTNFARTIALESTIGDILLGTTSGSVSIGTSTDTGHKLLVSGSGASGSVNLDNTLYVSGSRVGIGTSSPATTLDIRGTQTATGSIATTMLISSSLSASANSDTLVGLDINPSFNTGSFTSVQNIGLRITTDGAGSGVLGGLLVRTSGGTTLFSVDRQFGIVTIGNQLRVGQLNNSGGGNQIYFPGDGRVNINANGTGLGISFHAGQFGTELLRMFTNTGNLLIQNGGTFTDAGFKLDVNGTARVSGLLTTANINLGGSQLFFNQSGAPNNYIYSASNISILNGVNVRLAGGPVSINATNGGASADASAILDVQSTLKGFLPPRMTGAQAELISSPAEGLMVYATNGTGVTITSKGWWGYDGATWVKFN
jgi:hypothetical protein